VATAREQCVERFRLLDEIVVIDGGSRDDTVAVASAAGAVVRRLEDLLPQHPVPVGKGSALWKSLSCTSGDIVLFLDSDLTSFDERFIVGPLAPLLHHPEISFVKAWYQRPLSTAALVDDHGGGRVTEILVRPLLATFYPELAYFHQPLAGEYAVRRSVLERVGFSSGYGVDIGLILESFRLLGLQGFAQVDLKIRHHRNRSVLELGKMSFSIFQTLVHNLQKDGRIQLAAALSTLMISPRNGGWEQQRIEERMLPPMHQLAGSS
jgi:glucosyl-3-phosphoglycerate synthase